MGQKPVTFLRQVLAICAYSKLFNHHTLPQDAKERAREILDNCEGKSIGSYTKPAGINCVRNHVARYIEKRDGGITADPKNIYLISGTNMSLTLIFRLLIDCRNPAKTGIMVPVPNSPLISESVSLMHGAVIHYFLDEEQVWSLDVVELQRSLTEGRRHCVPKALCIVNPGSPTGHVLSRSCIESVIRFAAEERLFLLVDEAYQMNVYDESSQFHSFKKVLFEMGPKYSSTVELVTLFSISKGLVAEAGARGSVMELINLVPEVQELVELLSEIYASCPLTSQIVIDVATKPPQPGEVSYPVYISEKQSFQKEMSEKAHLTEQMFNSVPGMRCHPINSGIYAFPRIEIPAKAREKAKLLHQEPDLFYCLKLLEETGYFLIPGKVFGQRDGIFHFRMSILAPAESLKIALKTITQFHCKFTAEFS
ncbi:alanine aminotransferase 2-like isoform X2 [Mustelus asterias]